MHEATFVVKPENEQFLPSVHQKYDPHDHAQNCEPCACTWPPGLHNLNLPFPTGVLFLPAGQRGDEFELMSEGVSTYKRWSVSVLDCLPRTRLRCGRPGEGFEGWAR